MSGVVRTVISRHATPKRGKARCVRLSFLGAGFGLVGELTKLCEEQQLDKALEIVGVMDQHGIPLSRDVVYCLLQGCAQRKDVEAGRRVHSLMIRSRLDSISVLGDHLIRLFASCGNLTEANRVFYNVSKPSVYTWSAIISAHTELGETERTFELYQRMVQEGIQPDRVLFLSILKACSSTGALECGRMIHDQIVLSEHASETVIGNTLIDMYAKCMNLKDAQKVFDDLQNRTVVSFGAMITGYTANGNGLPALELFENMQQEGIKPSKVTFLSTLKACGNIKALGYGRLVHEQINQNRLESDVAIGSSLVDLYAKCGSIHEAYKVFDDMPIRNVASWSAMIAGYAQFGETLNALELYEKLLLDGIKPDKVMFWCIIQVCGAPGDFGNGRLIHGHIIRSGFESDMLIANTLLDMYAKCGSLKEARKLFDNVLSRNVVSWGTMIAGYAGHGHALPALELFGKMQEEGLKPNEVIFSCILRACGSIKAIRQARFVHDQVMQCGFESNVIVASALVDTYAKYGSLEEANKVFDKVQNRDLVLWGAIVAGYVAHEKTLPALELFEKMQGEGIKANAHIFSCALKACGSIGAVAQGRLIHNEIIQSGLDSGLVIGNILVDMYARCGNLDEGCKVFEELPDQDIAAWGAIIAGFARSGNVKLAVHFLEEMQQRQGLKPCDEIFTSVLAACSHAGLLEEGLWCFKCMIQDHHITPSIEHYSCMVDLLSRAGQLNEAADVLQTMALAPDPILWKSLLTSCRTYGNRELGRICFDRFIQLDLQGASGYVLMSSIYADA